MLAGRALKEIRKEFPDLQVEEIEVTKEPLRAIRDGVRMIPTLAAGNEKISGIFLSDKKIREFIKQLSQKESSGPLG